MMCNLDDIRTHILMSVQYGPLSCPFDIAGKEQRSIAKLHMKNNRIVIARSVVWIH